jgi:hypothetical protein
MDRRMRALQPGERQRPTSPLFSGTLAHSAHSRCISAHTRAKKSQNAHRSSYRLTVRALPMGTHFDATTPAFGIRVGKHRRTWIVMRGEERRRIWIGHYPTVTLSEARKEPNAFLRQSLEAADHVEKSWAQTYGIFITDAARKSQASQTQGSTTSRSPYMRGAKVRI